MFYFLGGISAFIVLRQLWRWWRSRIDVPPVSERWLAEKRGSRERD
jgi:hypothetical protein